MKRRLEREEREAADAPNAKRTRVESAFPLLALPPEILSDVIVMLDHPSCIAFGCTVKITRDLVLKHLSMAREKEEREYLAAKRRELDLRAQLVGRLEGQDAQAVMTESEPEVRAPKGTIETRTDVIKKAIGLRYGGLATWLMGPEMWRHELLEHSRSSVAISHGGNRHSCAWIDMLDLAEICCSLPSARGVADFLIALLDWNIMPQGIFHEDGDLVADFFVATTSALFDRADDAVYLEVIDLSLRMARRIERECSQARTLTLSVHRRVWHALYASFLHGRHTICAGLKLMLTQSERHVDDVKATRDLVLLMLVDLAFRRYESQA
jgi:hypothetical protein